MEIEGKDYITWLHEVRKEMWKERKKSGLSDAEWLRKITQEAEKILGKKILRIESTPTVLVQYCVFVKRDAG